MWHVPRVPPLSHETGDDGHRDRFLSLAPSLQTLGQAAARPQGTGDVSGQHSFAVGSPSIGGWLFCFTTARPALTSPTLTYTPGGPIRFWGGGDRKEAALQKPPAVSYFRPGKPVPCGRGGSSRQPERGRWSHTWVQRGHCSVAVAHPLAGSCDCLR